ncbi:cryptic autophosphorylating protein tyrosine kinase Etk [Escherichia coli]|uniref:Cryptic autophosphorylating protein tyrosine kinase Etk n=1 Tax=Escherichia coli TaxID=562 RepID=A0A377AUD6_ECOLX|nr:cryptic autophosphorylating protein tyrosine kinase Etk [Escherichia coli]
MDNPADSAVEAVRALRTSLHFAMMETENNILMITGATPDSGKTFVSSTLAAVIAPVRFKKCYLLMPTYAVVIRITCLP